MRLNIKNKTFDERFAETKFAKEGGSCFECCDYEGMYVDLKSFLKQEIADALDRVVLGKCGKNTPILFLTKEDMSKTSRDSLVRMGFNQAILNLEKKKAEIKKSYE